MNARKILLVAYQCGPGMGSVSQIGWEWYSRLCADNSVAAKEVLLAAEHVHRAALPAGIAALAAGEFRHHAARGHAGGQHVPVVAIACDDLVVGIEHRLHADHDGLLADIEVAEAGDEAHAVELAGLFLEATDEKHVPIKLNQFSLLRF